MNLRRWIPRLVVLAVVGSAGTYLGIEQPWASNVGITFQTVVVGKGTIAAQVTANGTLSARHTVSVGAQVSGKIIKLSADFNDHVTKGQVIAKLDPTLLQQQIDQMQAAYDAAVANEKKAEVSLFDSGRQRARNLDLFHQQLIAKQTYEGFEITDETNKTLLLAAKAAVVQAYANLEQAKTSLSYTTIYSPVDGIVLSRAVDEGQTVASSLSAPTLFTIAEDLSIMQIDTSVAESDVGRLKDGMPATFTVDAFTGKTFPGTVRQVRNSPTTTQGVVTYDAVIDVDNSEHLLRPGMTANVTFVLAQVNDAIKIPNAAFRFKPTREAMMAMREMSGAGSGGHHGSGWSGHHRGSAGSGAGSGGAAGDSGPTEMGPAGGSMPMFGGPGGAGGMGKRDLGDKKMLWKLVDGKPKMVLVKPGLTDGSTTEQAEGDLQQGDLLITAVEGVPAPQNQRKVGAF